MKCPACDNGLSRHTVAGVELDICQYGCGGIWFDQFEFRKFDEPHEYADAVLDLQVNSNHRVDQDRKRHCARCADQVMLRRYYSPKQSIAIDECAMCGGIWLDYGELGQIRNMFKSHEEFHDYARDFLQKEFGGELTAKYGEWSEEAKPFERFSNLFRFLYPSWWLPGSQDWGKY